MVVSAVAVAANTSSTFLCENVIGAMKESFEPELRHSKQVKRLLCLNLATLVGEIRNKREFSKWRNVSSRNFEKVQKYLVLMELFTKQSLKFCINQIIWHNPDILLLLWPDSDRTEQHRLVRGWNRGPGET